MKKNEEIDHEYTNELVCPYCGYTYRDSWEMSDDGTEECPVCEKEFVYSRDVSVTYSSSKSIPVLNNEEYNGFDDDFDKCNYIYDFIYQAPDPLISRNQLLEFFKDRDLTPSELKTINIVVGKFNDENIQKKLKLVNAEHNTPTI